MLAPSAAVEAETLVNCQITVPRFEKSHAGQSLAIIGNVAQLGAWSPSQAVRLLPSEDNDTMYSAVVQLPLKQKVEAKVRGYQIGLFMC